MSSDSQKTTRRRGHVHKTAVERPPRAEELADTEPRRGTLTDDRAPAAGAAETGDDPAALRRGTLIDRFVVLETLGAGGMGVVLSAYDPDLDRKVAIKLLKPRVFAPDAAAEAEARLLREAQATARVTHPGVITVHEVGTYRGQVFIAMEFVEGGTLRQTLELRRRDWRTTLDLFLQAGRGLAAAHRKGLVHRDFKPENVLVAADGSVRVTDFGLVSITGEVSQVARLPGAPRASSALEESLTETGAVMGTPAYMAPEQHLGQAIDTRSDQFSFCAALYEALYGERPFPGDDAGELAQNIVTGARRRPHRRAHVPGWLRQATLRGLQVDPEDRFASMDDLLAELEQHSARPSRLGQVAAAAGAAAFVVAAFAAGVLALGGQGAEEPPGEIEKLRAELAVTEAELDRNRRALARERVRSQDRATAHLRALERKRRSLESEREALEEEVSRMESQVAVIAPGGGEGREGAASSVREISLAGASGVEGEVDEGQDEEDRAEEKERAPAGERARRAAAPTAPPEALPDDRVEKILAGVRPQILRCGDPPDFSGAKSYEEWEGMRLSRFQGSVDAVLEVGPDGRVTRTRLGGGPVRVRRCMADILGGLELPSSRRGARLRHTFYFP